MSSEYFDLFTHIEIIQLISFMNVYTRCIKKSNVFLRTFFSSTVALEMAVRSWSNK